MPLAVLAATVTVVVDVADRLTVKLAVPPSVTVTLLIERLGGERGGGEGREGEGGGEGGGGGRGEAKGGGRSDERGLDRVVVVDGADSLGFSDSGVARTREVDVQVLG